jgi:hypothetical protein
LQQQLKPSLAVAGVLGIIAVIGLLIYLRSIGVGAPAAGAAPGLAQMKQSNALGSSAPPPPQAVYVPPGAPPGVRQMIGQSRSGASTVAPAPAAYIPPGAPTGVRQMIQQNPGGGAPGMPPSNP